jgi:hypothetical protein
MGKMPQEAAFPATNYFFVTKGTRQASVKIIYDTVVIAALFVVPPWCARKNPIQNPQNAAFINGARYFFLHDTSVIRLGLGLVLGVGFAVIPIPPLHISHDDCLKADS